MEKNGFQKFPGTAMTFLGIVLVFVGIGFGFSSATLQPLLQNSLIVVLGSIIFAVTFGGTAGWILGWTKIPHRWFWNSLTIAWAVCPLAVQLSSFDAMFGRRNWLALFSNVSYGRLLDGFPAVITVHSLSAIPWVILIVQAGRVFQSVQPEKAATLDLSWWKVFLKVSLPRNILLFFSAAIFVGILAFEQFQVTDVYQVRTWAEVWYLSFSMEQSSLWVALFDLSPSQLFPETWNTQPSSDSLSELKPSGLFLPVLFFAAGFTLVVGGSIQNWSNVTEESFAEKWKAGTLSDLWIRRLILFGTIFLPVCFLCTSLTIRAGLKATGNGQHASLQWSADHFISMFRYCCTDFQDPIIWSFLIGISAGCLLVLFGILIGWTIFRTKFFGIFLLLACAVSIACPAPLFSLLCYETFFLSENSFVRDLANNSILVPVVSLTLKGIGFTTVLNWILFRSISQETIDHATMEGAGWVRTFWEFAILRFASFHIGLVLAVTIWAAGDLAGTFAVLPAGIDTVPRRILGDLHAGAGDKVAMICLMQWITVLMAGFLSNRFFQRATME